jgi:excisionase family DNA binding protein
MAATAKQLRRTRVRVSNPHKRDDSSTSLRTKESVSTTAQLPELLTRKEAAAFLRATDQFVDRLIIRQQLPCIRIGFGARKQVRIRRSDLLEYLTKNEESSAKG